MENITHRRDS